MTEVAVSGLLAGYGVAVPVGAIAVLLVGLTARTSFRLGAAAALGVAAADGLYAAAAVLGGAALARLIEPVSGPLRWAAAAILGWLAAATAIRAIRHHRDPPRASQADPRMSTPARAFVALLGLTLLNPMTVVYFGALVVGRQAGAGDAADGAVFVVAAAAASASWQLLLAGSGSLLGRLLTGARGRLVTALGSSALIVVLAGRLVLV